METTATTTNEKLSGGKATIYFQSEYGLGIRRVEVSSWSVEIRPYAQYAAAVHFTFIPKGCRKARGDVQGYNPSLVIVEGWGGPEVASPFVKLSETSEVTVSRGRYMSCDPRWRSDFDEMLAASDARIVADYRTDSRFVR